MWPYAHAPGENCANPYTLVGVHEQPHARIFARALRGIQALDACRTDGAVAKWQTPET